MKKRIYWWVTALPALVLLVTAEAYAGAISPALERPAVSVRSAHRSVLLAATLAGPRVVAVGERGVVVLSDDDGIHWRQARQVPVSVTLTAVQFVGAREGWAVGHGGVILRTVDGGENWNLVADGDRLASIALEAANMRMRNAPGDEAAAKHLRAADRFARDAGNSPLLDLHFLDAQHGYVVGAYGLFFETRDGGGTWSAAMDRLHNPEGLHLYAIRARGKDVFIVGEQGLIRRSQDDGRTFHALPTPYDGSWFGLALLPDGLVVVGLRGNAFHSADDGQVWTRIEGGAAVSLLAVAPKEDGSVLIASQAGQVFASQDRRVMTPVVMPLLPPLAGVIPLSKGAVIAYGIGGVVRLPQPTEEQVSARP